MTSRAECMRQWLRGARAALVAIGLGVGLGCLAQSPLSEPAVPEIRFDRAEFVVSDDRAPPLTGWRLQALPDEWRHNHPGLSGVAWYRMRFSLEAPPTQALALFVPRVAVTGEFRLNGSVLNPEVRFMEPGGLIGSQMTNRTHLITLPAGLFRTGENVVDIRVQGDTVTGGVLSVVRLGTVESLRGSWALRDIPQRVVPQALFVLLTATLGVGLIVWWRERRASHRHFAVVMALWAALLGVYLFPDLPLTRNGLAILLALLVVSFYWALLSLCWRFSGSTWHWYPRLLNATSSGLLVLIAAIALSGRGFEALPWVLLPTLVLRLLATVMLAQWAWRERSPGAFALAGAEMVWFAGALQFMAIVLRWLPAEPFVFTPSDGLPLYAVLLYFFVERLILDREQAARDKLAAIGAERARILHDMHDGMVSHLITALRLAQREDVDRTVLARTIDEALQDLRLIIDSLDLSEQDLMPLLGNLRYRLHPRLAALGIRLDWDLQAPAAEVAGLTPQSALGVLRIIQEALNNAMRHARPEVITVSITDADGGISISVADDGVGFDGDGSGIAGRGLAGMRQRATRLGGQLRVTGRSGGGTVVSLWLPSAAVAEPSTHAG